MAEKRLSAELRQELLGLLPFSVDAKTEYTPRQFRKKKKEGEVETEKYVIPEEFRPVFTMRCYNKGESDALRKLMLNIKDQDEDTLREWARKIILDWRNFYDAGTSNEIAYKADPSGGADKDLFTTIPAAVVSDLLFHGVKISGLMDVERSSLGS